MIPINFHREYGGPSWAFAFGTNANRTPSGWYSTIRVTTSGRGESDSVEEVRSAGPYRRSIEVYSSPSVRSGLCSRERLLFSTSAITQSNAPTNANTAMFLPGGLIGRSTWGAPFVDAVANFIPPFSLRPEAASSPRGKLVPEIWRAGVATHNS
jgi:hypothetical protein